MIYSANSKGYTLLEIIIVVVILTFIMGMIISSLINIENNSVPQRINLVLNTLAQKTINTISKELLRSGISSDGSTTIYIYDSLGNKYKIDEAIGKEGIGVRFQKVAGINSTTHEVIWSNPYEIKVFPKDYSNSLFAGKIIIWEDKGDSNEEEPNIKEDSYYPLTSCSKSLTFKVISENYIEVTLILEKPVKGFKIETPFTFKTITGISIPIY